MASNLSVSIDTVNSYHTAEKLPCLSCDDLSFPYLVVFIFHRQLCLRHENSLGGRFIFSVLRRRDQLGRDQEYKSTREGGKYIVLDSRG